MPSDNNDPFPGERTTVEALITALGLRVYTNYKNLKAQFPTVERVAVPPSGGVSFYVVIAMKPRFAGEARQSAWSKKNRSGHVHT